MLAKDELLLLFQLLNPGTSFEILSSDFELGKNSKGGCSKERGRRKKPEAKESTEIEAELCLAAREDALRKEEEERSQRQKNFT